MTENFKHREQEDDVVERAMQWAEEKIAEQTEGKIELSNEEFQNIIDSKRFLEVIKRAGRETKNSGMESGFDICVFEDKSFVIPGAERGSAAGMISSGEPTEFIYGKPLSRADRKRKHCLIGFHFHPTSGTAIVPSEGDLNILSREEYAIDSLIGICQIEEKTINILLIRPQKGVHVGKIPDLAEKYEEEIDKYGNTDWLKPEYQGDVLEILRVNGFEPVFVSFEQQKGGYVLTEISREEISKMGDIDLRFTI